MSQYTLSAQSLWMTGSFSVFYACTVLSLRSQSVLRSHANVLHPTASNKKNTKRPLSGIHGRSKPTIVVSPWSLLYLRKPRPAFISQNGFTLKASRVAAWQQFWKAKKAAD